MSLTGSPLRDPRGPEFGASGVKPREVVPDFVSNVKFAMGTVVLKFSKAIRHFWAQVILHTMCDGVICAFGDYIFQKRIGTNAE